MDAKVWSHGRKGVKP